MEMNANPIYNMPHRHAFVMTGTKTLFLCHLTQLHTEMHMYQLVLRVRLPDYVMQIYRDDQLRHPDSTYFLGNVELDEFSLPDLQTGARVAFIGEFWRDIPDEPVYTHWPWRDEKPVAANFDVEIERVVHYRHFDFNFNYPNSLTYFMFGAGNEAHLYHYQTREPDFDQVISLTAAPHWLPPRQLEAGININFPELPVRPEGEPVYCTNPLVEHSYVVQYNGLKQIHGKDLPRYKVHIGRNLWCSTKVTNADNPCNPS
jgi:hypothetical protein